MIFQDYEDKSGTLKLHAALKHAPAQSFHSMLQVIGQNSLEMDVMIGKKRGGAEFKRRLELVQTWTTGWSSGTGRVASVVVGSMVTEDSNALFIIVTENVNALLGAVRDTAKVAQVQES